MPPSSTEITQYFVNQNAQELEDALQNHSGNPVALEQGPLNKSDATILLENIIKNFLANQAGSGKPHVQFSIENNTAYAQSNGKKHDLTALLKAVNMNHFNFDTTDADNYIQFINSVESRFKPMLNGRPETPSMDDYEQNEAKGTHPRALTELNFAEKTAINIYTGPFYGSGNSL